MIPSKITFGTSVGYLEIPALGGDHSFWAKIFH